MDLPTSKKLRPTISLCVIAKNEEKNVRRFLDSFDGAVDEIIFVDTGSTDRTKEIAQELGCKVYDFAWVNSFCKARNFAFSKATCDYIIWADLDDVLSNKPGFIQWRDFAMEFAECWFNTYNYALDPNGKPIVSFVRERVMKRSLNPTWQYDLHEGIICKNEWSRDYAVAWTINHLRDQDDIKADKSRNVTILEALKKENGLDPRLQFYFGKELYEAGRPVEALAQFDEALNLPLEVHDKMLALQYGADSAIACAEQLKDEFADQKSKYFEKALELCHRGIAFEPTRAEFHATAGDVYLRMNNLVKAMPYYGAAKKCLRDKDLGSPYEGAIYSFNDVYGLKPSLNLSKIYANLGKIEEAKAEARECIEKYDSQEAKDILAEIERMESVTRLDNGQIETDDIVFTTPLHTAYPFDEEIYKEKPLGGSETALVCMAKHLKELTGRRVIVFNQRETDLMADSGVEYLSNVKLTDYFSKFRPKAHIAWRHNIEITKADTYLWCHDLVTPSVESRRNFKKIMCLTPFHKNYVKAKQHVPEEKIWVTRNGITPSKFDFERKDKNPNKLVWMSSPDRGLDRAMLVCDEVRKEFPEVELHVYYGLGNLYKYGQGKLADHLKAMMAERPWVKYHGFTEQSKMYRDVSDAVVWVHPCNFIESFCITALEMLALGIFPVTRRLGALQDTLRTAEFRGQAILLDHDCITEQEIHNYARAVKGVLFRHQWEQIDFDPSAHDWKEVAKEWIQEMDLAPVDSTRKEAI